MALVFARVERAVPPTGHADPIDPEQCAVEHHVSLTARNLDRLRQGGCPRREQIQRLAHVAVDRRGADGEPAGQIGIGLTLAQVGHHQQRLTPSIQPPPPRPPLRAPLPKQIGKHDQRPVGHRHPRRVRKHTKLLAWTS